MSLLSSIKEKNPSLINLEFRYYLVLRFALIFALNMQSTTIYFWIYQITEDKLKLGLIGLAEVIPAVVFSLFSGHFVDLMEKRKLIARCAGAYLFIGMVLFYLTTRHATNSLGLSSVLYLLYSLVFIGGVIRSFFGPAGFSILALIVPRVQYANATSWSSMAFQVGAVLGPLLAGVMIGWHGVQASMALVVLLEIIPFWAILKIQTKPVIPQKKEPMMHRLTEGLNFVFKTPVLLGAMTLDLFSVLFGGAVALLPVFQKEILMISDVGYGILRAAPGVGALITLGLLTFLPLKKNPGYKLFFAVGGFGLSIIIFGLSKSFLLSLIALVVSGMFDAVSVVIRQTILQLVTPDEMRGRVSAVNTMFVSSSNELGDFESGLMAHWIGTVQAVVLGGCITLFVVGTTYLKAPQLRRFSFKKYEHSPDATLELSKTKSA